jgi:predicted amino acid racemase
LNRSKLKHNYEFLTDFFQRHNKEWGIVTKMLCGHREFLKVVLDLGIKQVHDSRISNLKTIKKINPFVETVYIKPPAKKSIRSIVQYADVSFNTEIYTLQLLSEEAQRQQKNHKVIIMVEMGDLREGVLGDDLINFYSEIFNLKNIEVVGLGANFNCLNGVMPTHDKMIQLSLYKQLIEKVFNREIKYISGGSSVTIPLLWKKMIPQGINHFRIGESFYNGQNLFTNKTIKGMKTDIFKLYAEIIELTEKPVVPIGERATNAAGDMVEFDERDLGKKTYRAILDIGLLDIDTRYIHPTMKGIEFSGASSDMVVMDIGKTNRNLKVGDLISFHLDYMGILSVMNSNYIGKVIV